MRETEKLKSELQKTETALHLACMKACAKHGDNINVEVECLKEAEWRNSRGIMSARRLREDEKKEYEAFKVRTQEES